MRRAPSQGTSYVMASSLEGSACQNASRPLLKGKLSSDEKTDVEHLKKKRKHSHDLQHVKHERAESEGQNGDRWNITTNDGSRSPSPNKHNNGLKTKLKKIKVEGQFALTA